MTILAYPIASIIARPNGDVLHDENFDMRRRLDAFEVWAILAQFKVLRPLLDPPAVHAPAASEETV